MVSVVVHGCVCLVNFHPFQPSVCGQHSRRETDSELEKIGKLITKLTLSVIKATSKKAKNSKTDQCNMAKRRTNSK